MLSSVGAGAGVALVLALAKPLADALGLWIAVGFWSIVGVALLVAFVAWLRDKERLQPLDDIHVCLLRTDHDEVAAVLTPDKQYVEAVIEAINKLAAKHKR
jgi:hypothetical protein